MKSHTKLCAFFLEKIWSNPATKVFKGAKDVNTVCRGFNFPPLWILMNPLPVQRFPQILKSPEVFCKKMCSYKFGKFTGKQLCQSLFLIKLCRPRACIFIKKETLAQLFSCEFCTISKSQRTAFSKHLESKCLYIRVYLRKKIFVPVT